jgi:hypothetical protein
MVRAEGLEPHSLRRWSLIQCVPRFRHAHVVSLEELEPQLDPYERPALTIELLAPTTSTMPHFHQCGYAEGRS